MSGSRDRVRKYRAVRKARIQEIREVNEIIHSRANISNSNRSCTEHDTHEEFMMPHQSPRSIGDTYMESDTCERSNSDILIQKRSQVIDNSENSPIESFKNNADASLTDKLRLWAVECNIQQNHLDKLLNILREEVNCDLPKSSKTFLGTAEATYVIEDMDDDDTMNTNGQFVYFGIEKILHQIINTEFHENDIQLLINIDGVPVTASGSKSFWPILCKVYYYPDVYQPFTVGIYFGKGKPKFIDEYLKKFIDEINKLQEHGISIGEYHHNVELKAFISDTPARAYLKCTKGHGGYNACERCMVPGELVKVGKGSTVIYPGVRHEKRTKSSFIRQEDPEHHTGVSPLLRIRPEIDLTKLFVLDHMHLFFNGVMKKLIQLWMSGPLKVRLSRLQKVEVSRRLLHLRVQIPVEFQRKPRSIFEYLKWKATEFRFFLLYCGPIVLKNILPSLLYDHFLLLHVACRILCSEKLALTENRLAEKYLNKFVLSLPYLYEPRSLVINMHNLLHIVDDVRNLNCPLSRISCFPFENALGKMKRTLRTPNKPLSQLCRRLHEHNLLLQKKPELPVNKILKQKNNGEQVSIQSVRWNSTVISTKISDNMVILSNNMIMEISTIYGENDSVSGIEIQGKIWKRLTLVYKYPCKSSFLQTWKLPLTSYGTATYPLTYVSHKLVRLSRGQNVLFVMPLLH